MKNVMVTGCSSGTGRCIAEGLKDRGYKVFTTAGKEKDIDQLIQAGFDVVMLDLTDSDAINSAVEQVINYPAAS
ncbi:MAG: SDR family NAD(P)-dependent oxidoreductase [Proteobacteria bacterium]|nr:SDR family NAD(P)-dependent oxidoreductase [Pseudomonadota bacterium]